MTEAQLGAMVEFHIRADGPGYKGVRLVRALCEVGAGPVGSTKGTLLVPSLDIQIEEGDFVMIELATVADGYWSDLTYMAVAGKPNDRQVEVYNHLLDGPTGCRGPDACRCFLRRSRCGRPFSYLEKVGLGEYFVHITGHGVGLRYHEFIPFLMPGASRHPGKRHGQQHRARGLHPRFRRPAHRRQRCRRRGWADLPLHAAQAVVELQRVSSDA